MASASEVVRVIRRSDATRHCPHRARRREGAVVHGVRFDVLRDGELPRHIDSFLSCGRSHIVHFFAGHPTVLARQDPAYCSVLNGGDLNVVDGVSIALALRLYGHPATRTTGTDAIGALCRWGVERGLRHYFYGGRPAVVELMRRRLVRAYSGIEIVGVDAPPFDELDAYPYAEVADRIRATGADLVWIGLGAPKQDLVAERLRALEAAPVLLCVGAAFDFFSGAKRRAPVWMQRGGVEWLYRLVSEPRRLWRRYLLGNPRFVAGVLRDYFQVRRR